MAETSPDNPEELKAMVKNQLREIKTQKKKLDALEQRYISRHKEIQELQTEREVFIRLCKLIFPDKTWEKTITTEEYEGLEAAWLRREEDMRKSVTEMSESLNREVQKWKSLSGKKDEEILEKNEQLVALKVVQSTLAQTQASLAEAKGEVAVLEKQLENLKLENASLRSIQDDLAKKKASSLLAALDQRPSKPDPVAELERLQKQLTGALKRIEELENVPTSRDHEVPSTSSSMLEDLTSQRIDYEHRLNDLKERLEAQRNEFQEHRKKAQKMIMEKEMAIERLKQAAQRDHVQSPNVTLSEESCVDPLQQLASLRLRIMELERTQGTGHLNLEFLRNIVAKYMEYMNAGNWEEAKTLEKVIVTALDFAPEEVEFIEKAKENSGIMGKVATALGAKSPGVGVSHNTLHTVEGRKRARLQTPHSVNVSLSNTYRGEEEKYEIVPLDKS